MTDDIFRVGVISNTHGLRGELKVFPTTDDPDRFFYLKDALLGDDEQDETLLPVVVEKVRFFKNTAIVKLKGYDNIDDVLPFRKKSLYVTRENAIPLEEGEFYIKDLIGISVVTEEGEHLGVLNDVIETGANQVYSVHLEGRKDLLIPAIKQCIIDISLEEGRMIVHLLPGLLDL